MTAAQSLFHITAFDAVGSTSDEAKARARDGAPHGTVIRANEQTGGRGRRGNTWSSPKGNLYLSIVLHPDIAASQAGQLSFVAATALADAVALLVPGADVALKWPNDLLLDGKKAAGILLETETKDSRIDWVVLGMGVNIAKAPDYAAKLNDASDGIDPDTLMDAVLAALHNRYARWLVDGFAQIRADWLARAAGLGGRITVRLPDSELEGVFAGLDDDGTLLLEQDGGAQKRIASGEVFCIGGG